MSNNYDTLLIESYREQNTALRQDDSMLHRMTAIILPVSIIALVVGFYRPEIPILLALLGGVILMTFWISSCHVLYISIHTRLAIINEIERHWEIPEHKHFLGIRAEIFGIRPKWLYQYFGSYRGALFYRATYMAYFLVALGIYIWKLDYFNLDMILQFVIFIIVGGAFIISGGVFVFLWYITERPIKTCKSSTLERVRDLLERKKQTG